MVNFIILILLNAIPLGLLEVFFIVNEVNNSTMFLLEIGLLLVITLLLIILKNKVKRFRADKLYYLYVLHLFLSSLIMMYGTHLK